MQIVIDVKEDKAKKFIDFLKTLDYVKIQEKKDIRSFAGMWKDKDISLEKIREKAWKK